MPVVLNLEPPVDSQDHLTLLKLFSKSRGNNLFDTVRSLLERGVQINSTDSEGNTALMNFCANVKMYNQPEKMEEVIRLLIQYEIDVTVTNSATGKNALHILSSQYTGWNLLKLIQLLVEAGIDPKKSDNQGNNALHYVCAVYRQDDLLKVISLLVKVYKIDPKSTNNDGVDPLFTLLFYYDTEKKKGKPIANLVKIMKFLLKSGADVNNRTVKQWNSILALFSQQYLHKDFLAATKLLIKHKVEINVVDEDGCNLLIFLFKLYRGIHLVKLVNILIGAGIQLNTTSTQGWGPLFFLLTNSTQNDKFIAVTRLLVNAGLDIRMQDNDGRNLLHWLFELRGRNDSIETVRFLVNEMNIDRNAVDNEGKKPIDYLKKLNPKRKNEVYNVIKFLSQPIHS